jgi:DNA-binding beta-propeller fold protein YncE
VAGVVVAGLAGGYLLLGGKGSKARHHAAPVLAAPGCTTQLARADPVTHTPHQLLGIGGRPFDVMTAPGSYAFVSIGSGVMVLRTSTHVPTILWTSTLGHAQGEAITPDHRYLLVADGSGIDLFRVQDLEQGPASPIGTLASPGEKHAVEVALTPDGRFAFVTYQSTASVGVFNLQQAIKAGAGPADLVGLIPVGAQPIGVAVSPDGQDAYVTSRVPGAPESAGGGVVNVISVAKAEAHPAAAVIKTVAAGCRPARVIASPDGQHVWVTAGGANALLAYSAAKLVSDPRHALLATVAVGSQPLGMVFVSNGSRILIADSNKDKPAGGASNLAVVDAAKALAGHASLIGYLQSGTTPRQFAVTPNGRTALVTNTDSAQLQTVNLTHLP